MIRRCDFFRLVVLACCTLMSTGTVLANPAQPVIAVFGVQDPSGRFSATELDQLTTYFATELARGGVFKVVPQSQLKSALGSLKEGSYSACYDEECQIEIGREVAAEKSVMTQILAVGSKCAVTSTLWDLRSSASERATRVKVDCDPDSLVAGLEQTAIELKAKTPGSAPAPSIARPAPKPEVKPTPPPPVESKVARPTTQQSADGPSLALPLVVIGAGVAGGVLGAIFIAKASGHATNAEDPTFVGGQVEIERAESSQTIGFVGLGAGLGLATLGTILLIVELGSDHSSDVAAAPMFTKEGGGLALVGTF